MSKVDSNTNSCLSDPKTKKLSIFEESGVELEDLQFCFSKMFDIPEIREQFFEYTSDKKCSGNISPFDFVRKHEFP
jgi:hypothetical protein